MINMTASEIAIQTKRPGAKSREPFLNTQHPTPNTQYLYSRFRRNSGVTEFKNAASSVNFPDTSRIPTSTSSAPEIRCTHGRYFRNFWNQAKKLSTAHAATRKGIASPAL